MKLYRAALFRSNCCDLWRALRTLASLARIGIHTYTIYTLGRSFHFWATTRHLLLLLAYPFYFFKPKNSLLGKGLPLLWRRSPLFPRERERESGYSYSFTQSHYCRLIAFSSLSTLAIVAKQLAWTASTQSDSYIGSRGCEASARFFDRPQMVRASRVAEKCEFCRLLRFFKRFASLISRTATASFEWSRVTPRVYLYSLNADWSEVRQMNRGCVQILFNCDYALGYYFSVNK